MEFKFASNKSKIEGFIVGCMMFNMAGALAHLGGHMNEFTYPGDDYSLSNRFESAYCINAAPETKQYHVYPVGKKQKDVENPEVEQYMLRSPFATIPLMLACGALGMFAGAKLEEEPRYRSYPYRNQRTR